MNKRQLNHVKALYSNGTPLPTCVLAILQVELQNHVDDPKLLMKAAETIAKFYSTTIKDLKNAWKKS